MNAMVASMKCAFVTPILQFWCWYATLNASSAGDPSISVWWQCEPPSGSHVGARRHGCCCAWAQCINMSFTKTYICMSFMSLEFIYVWFKYMSRHTHLSFKDVYNIHMSFTSIQYVYMLFDNTSCWKDTCIPWLHCRNQMRDPDNMGLVIRLGAARTGVETVLRASRASSKATRRFLIKARSLKPRTPRAVSQNKSYGLVELLCGFVVTNTNTFKPISATISRCSCGKGRSKEKFAIRKYMRMRWIQKFIWRLVNACGRTKGSSSTCPRRLWNSTLTRTKDSASVWRQMTSVIWRLWRLITMIYQLSASATSEWNKIERSDCLGAPEFQIAIWISGGGRNLQSQTLQIMAWFKASGSEANLWANQ